MKETTDSDFEKYKRENWGTSTEEETHKGTKPKKVAHNKFSQIKSVLPPIALPEIRQINSAGEGYSARKSHQPVENYHALLAERAERKKKEDELKYQKFQEHQLK